MNCAICKEDKNYHHFKIEFIDRILIMNEIFEKIIYSSVCNLCKFEYEEKMNEYFIIKKINKIKDPKIKNLLIDFDDYNSD